MERKKKGAKIGNIQRKLFWLQFVLIVTMAIFLGVAGTLVNIHFEEEKRDQNLQNVAEAIARSPLLLEDTDTPVLSEYLDSLRDTLDDIDVISVVGKDNIRLYHSTHDLIGKPYDGTLPDFSSAKDGYYAVNEKGPSGTQRRAYAAIYNKDGEYLGFVMTIMLMKNVQQEITQILWVFIPITLAAVVLEVLISTRFSIAIKKSLLGFEPDVFSAMYKIRDNILESLDEGIIATNTKNEVQYMNKAAVAMLGEVSTFDEHVHLERENILLDSVPVKEKDIVVGSISILHDRAEYTKLMEDLTGTRYLVDSMRANNHDFTNKLHVILGLIQMEMYEDAVSYIQNISMVQRETIGKIMKAVDEPALAALLIGKSARASELNVKFILREGTLYEKNVFSLSSEMLVTIVGNLLDNALEDMNNSADNEPKELLFGIYSRPNTLLITVDDTGNGISPENMERVFENGYSTKGDGRGTGLFLVKSMVENAGGQITVESQVGVGTSFSISFLASRE